jgi:hypothetical protein
MTEAGVGSSPDSSYDEALDEGEEPKRPGGSLLDQLQGDMRPVEEYVGQYVRPPPHSLFIYLFIFNFILNV